MTDDASEEREAMNQWRDDCRAQQAALDALLEDAPDTVDGHIEDAAESVQDSIDSIGDAIEAFDAVHAEEDE